MKPIVLFTLTASLFHFAIAQPGVQTREQEAENTDNITDSLNLFTAELRQSALDFKNAYNTGDTAALASFYAEDAYYVSPHVPDLMIRGHDRIRDNWQKGIAMGGQIDTVEVLAVGSSCDLAYLVSKYEATNKGVKVSGRNVLIMRRINGKWLIATHASVVRD